MNMSIYRVQDADGRGPWRPGFSHHWIDDDAPPGRLTETVMDLMPLGDIRRLPSGMHYGCGCRSLHSLMSWFSRVERQRLQSLRYRVVVMRVDEILRESDWQVFFARRRPLSEGATVIRWSFDADIAVDEREGATA